MLKRERYIKKIIESERDNKIERYKDINLTSIDKKKREKYKEQRIFFFLNFTCFNM